MSRLVSPIMSAVRRHGQVKKSFWKVGTSFVDFIKLRIVLRMCPMVYEWISFLTLKHNRPVYPALMVLWLFYKVTLSLWIANSDNANNLNICFSSNMDHAHQLWRIFCWMWCKFVSQNVHPLLIVWSCSFNLWKYHSLNDW